MMRRTVPQKLEDARVKEGPFLTTATDGFNGAFQLMGPNGRSLRIIASDAKRGGDKYPWDHVSVSIEGRCPNWKEMCFVKDLFFDEQEAVIQYHPPASMYVNNH